MRRSLLFASLVLLIVLALAAWKESLRPAPRAMTPTLTGQVEYCLTCHADLPEISASHPVQAFGCVICHGGERLALEANLAHSTLRGGKNPSDLAVVQASCGGDNCHSGTAQAERNHIQRVMTSLQATYAGAIASIRYTFGDQPDLTARQGIFAVQDPTSQTEIHDLAAFDPAQEKSPAVQSFGARCLSCHLSAQPPSGPEYARFTGCSACHTPSVDAAVLRDGRTPRSFRPSFAPTSASDTTATKPIHRLTTDIPYSQCNTCHNRGNYDLRDMSFHPRSDDPTGRLQDYYQPIAQFSLCEWRLDCIDCHTRQEAMGDGNLYGSMKDSQTIQCRTCHGTLTELPLTRTITDPNDLALRLAFLNPVIDLKVGDTILVTAKGEPLWNTRQLPDGTYELFGKDTRQRFVFRPVKGSGCQQNPDQQESRYCHACHAVER